MTRTAGSRAVDDGFAAGRLENARAFRRAARDLADLADAGTNGNPIVSLVVSAAVAYADAIVASAKGRVNRQDHQAAARALRDAVGNRLPAAQERRVARILREKDAAQYGVRTATRMQALDLLGELDEFAGWVEAYLRG